MIVLPQQLKEATRASEGMQHHSSYSESEERGRGLFARVQSLREVPLAAMSNEPTNGARATRSHLEITIRLFFAILFCPFLALMHSCTVGKGQ